MRAFAAAAHLVAFRRQPESITRVSGIPQNRGCIAAASALEISRIPGTGARFGHLTAHPVDHRLVVEIVEDVADPARQLPALAFPEAAVVIAGEPMRIPLVTNGDRGSLGTAFLLTVMSARPSAASAVLPVRPLSIRSTRNRWLSVPPETILSRVR